MIDVAMHGTKGVTLAASRTDRRFRCRTWAALWQLARGARRGVHGPGGGYTWHAALMRSRSPTLSWRSTRPIDATEVRRQEVPGGRPALHDTRLWANLNSHIFQYLRSDNLAQLVAAQDKPGVNVVHDHRGPGAGARKTEAETVA
jgi:hypothetical protein